MHLICVKLHENGREPGKIEFFEITHSKKNKNDEGGLIFINDISQDQVVYLSF